jgi:hypothetical protein
MSSIKLDKWKATSGGVQKTPVIQIVQKVVDRHSSTYYDNSNEQHWETPLTQSISLHNRDSKVLVMLDFIAGSDYWNMWGVLTRNGKVIDDATGYNVGKATPVTWTDNNYEYNSGGSGLSEYSAYQCNRLTFLDTPEFLDSSNTVQYGFFIGVYDGYHITFNAPSYSVTRQNNSAYYDTRISTMTLMEVQQ